MNKNQRASPPHIKAKEHCPILGSNIKLTRSEWERLLTLSRHAKKEETKPNENKPAFFQLKTLGQIKVSVITSLYRGGKYVSRFMQNITTQQHFDAICELIIIDACSPENEFQHIQPYLARHSNIRYVRLNERVSIYKAWNLAIQQSRGQYITNANLDDLRRQDSLVRQASVLDSLPFVDIVYQDLFYTLDSTLSFDEIAAVNVRTMLPLITPRSLMSFNSPHNAPMWRKCIHERNGMFDENYQSAGDWDFWLRCLSSRNVFYKLNDPHVAYFFNPDGLSTRQDGPSVKEGMEALRVHQSLRPEEESLVTKDKFIGKLAEHVEIRYLHVGDRYSYAQQSLRLAAQQLKFGPVNR
jgi:glycosyltransferase involved in cell wall biosynthesis